MLKILYAAANNEDSRIQLIRFLQAVYDKPYHIKIAAYKKSSHTGNIDWTLDSLVNVLRPTLWSTDSEAFNIYFDQVKSFSPHIIISDLEYFTSYIGHLLDIPVWQCSSALINFALLHKYNLGLFKNYSYILNRDFSYAQRMINIIDNSATNLVYSHFGEVATPPSLKEGFSWITPYHVTGKISPPCCHDIMAASFKNYKPLIKILNNQRDSICFTEEPVEKYSQVKMKYLYDENEYFCNLRNCDWFMCSGQSTFLSDAFYNEKYSIIIPQDYNAVSITNFIMSEKLGLSSIVYHENDMNFSELANSKINVMSERQLFLHEKIEQFFV